MPGFAGVVTEGGVARTRSLELHAGAPPWLGLQGLIRGDVEASGPSVLHPAAQIERNRSGGAGWLAAGGGGGEVGRGIGGSWLGFVQFW